MATKNADYYMDNPDEFSELSVEEQARILDGKPEEEETEETTETETVEEETEEETEEPVVMARDGKHTIPYDEYKGLQEEVVQLKGLAQQQHDMIVNLQTDMQKAKEADAGTGKTEAQEQVIEEYQGLYPEVFEDLKGTILNMTTKQVNAILEKEREAQAKAIEEYEAMEAQEAENRKAHFEAIDKVHADRAELIKSGKVDEWVKTQPALARKFYEQVLEGGSAQDVIELLNEFKESNKGNLSAKDVDEKAKKALEEAKKKGPTSLSNVPAGKAGSIDNVADLIYDPNTSGEDIDRLLEGKNPDQIRAIIDRYL